MVVTGASAGIDGRSLTRAVAKGVPPLVPLLALQLLLLGASDDPSNAWGFVLFPLFLWAFWRTGRAVATLVATRTLQHAALAALGLFLVWLPVRLLVAVAGDSDRPFAGVGAAIALGVFTSMAAAVLARRSAPPEEGAR